MLLIGDRDWHQLKSNQKRRGAELLAAALVQLLRQGDNRDVEDLTSETHEMKQLEAFDMFPFTEKLEWLAVLN